MGKSNDGAAGKAGKPSGKAGKTSGKATSVTTTVKGSGKPAKKGKNGKPASSK